MAASTAVRQTALSLDAAFMEDAVPVVPVATTRRQTGRNLAALLIISAIASLALGSALAPSADAPSLRGQVLSQPQETYRASKVGCNDLSRVRCPSKSNPRGLRRTRSSDSSQKRNLIGNASCL